MGVLPSSPWQHFQNEGVRPGMGYAGYVIIFTKRFGIAGTNSVLVVPNTKYVVLSVI